MDVLFDPALSALIEESRGRRREQRGRHEFNRLQSEHSKEHGELDAAFVARKWTAWRLRLRELKPDRLSPSDYREPVFNAPEVSSAPFLPNLLALFMRSMGSSALSLQTVYPLVLEPQHLTP